MAVFLVELYVAEADGSAVRRSVRGIVGAAEQARRDGTPVEYIRSIFIPEDETCFLMFEVAAIDTVRSVADRAAVQFERITEAVVESKDDCPCQSTSDPVALTKESKCSDPD